MREEEKVADPVHEEIADELLFRLLYTSPVYQRR
jgi:hypothetical protein